MLLGIFIESIVFLGIFIESVVFLCVFLKLKQASRQEMDGLLPAGRRAAEPRDARPPLVAADGPLREERGGHERDHAARYVEPPPATHATFVF